jgi:hypothetical protein
MPEIPEDIKRIYGPLTIQVIELHVRWICYKQLFAGSKRRVDLLNKCASNFFFYIQNILSDDIFIYLSKLTDKPSSRNGLENLSLCRLQSQLTKHGNQELAEKNSAILSNLQSKVLPIREWRNKKLSHSDLKINLTPNVLPNIPWQLIEEALSLVRDYLNTIEQHYNNGEIDYADSNMNDDADSLVAYLGYGLRYEELRREKKIAFDDWLNCNWHDS